MTTTHDFVLGCIFILGAWVTFGSFGVFIKTKAVVAAKVDPLVFQTYKTAAVFLSSWLVLTYRPFEWTYWGIVGSLVWVPAGVGAITAVRFAGLSIAQGIWSGLSVPISFLWGAIVFGNHVKSWPLAVLSIVMIVAGTTGMTYASAPRKQSAATGAAEEGVAAKREAGVPHSDSATSADGVSLRIGTEGEGESRRLLDKSRGEERATETSRGDGGRLGALARRSLGLAAAVATGGLAGTMYVPLHFSGKKAHGIQYLMSFGIGAVIVNAGLLAFYYGGRLLAGKPLPSFHFRVTLIPGLCTGIFWAAGNCFSILATLYLGQAIGATTVSLSMLGGGLWGIFYYKEIAGTVWVSLWFAFAVLTLAGVVVLLLYG